MRDLKNYKIQVLFNVKNASQDKINYLVQGRIITFCNRVIPPLAT